MVCKTDDDCRYKAAFYRVRLFLSVDLSGSTAFKTSKAGEDRRENASPKWVTVFQNFYTDFPREYKTKYQNKLIQSAGDNECPSLWKAVGDELVFCGRVKNKQAVVIALNSFIETIHSYRKYLQDEGLELNLKGAGWLAAFPEPNRTVQLKKNKASPELLLASEALEKAADKNPFDFDFLGKAIDTGFRVTKNATPERFVLSVQLAHLLTNTSPDLGFAHHIHFSQPILLKGVNKGEPYPVLHIDTMQHLPTEKIRKHERSLLKQANIDRDELAKYLKEYCSVVGTDEIVLTTSIEDTSSLSFPQSYEEHKESIAKHLELEREREFLPDKLAGLDDEQGSSSLPDAEGLEPLPK